MKIKKNEKPPIYDQIVQAGMNPSLNAIYTYGDTIYVPSGREVPDDIIAHEETHCDQQGADPDAWWSRYLDDPYFRIQQETEAYAVQYDFICETTKDRNWRDKILRRMATVLSGPTYGNVIGSQSAYSMIKNKAKTK